MDTGEELQPTTVTNEKKRKHIFGFFSFDLYPLGKKVR